MMHSKVESNACLKPPHWGNQQCPVNPLYVLQDSCETPFHLKVPLQSLPHKNLTNITRCPLPPQYIMTIASTTGVSPHPLNIAYHLNMSLLLVIKLRKVKPFSFTSTIHALNSQNIFHVINQKCNEIQTIKIKYLWFQTAFQKYLNFMVNKISK